MRSARFYPYFAVLARVVMFVVAILASAFAANQAAAQDVPLISGGVGFFTDTKGGNTTYELYAKPELVAPLGQHVLAETRASIVDVFAPNPSGGYMRDPVFKTIDYLQADVIACPHLTIVGGEFLTPFGTYNERLTQIWIENFQDPPLIYGAGNMNTGSSVGGMVRGSVVSTQKFSISYAAYYSGNSTSQYFGANRSSGGQGQIYFPAEGLEIGGSYGRSLYGTHENFEGMHLWWEPIGGPLRFRSEFAHTPHAQGYWFEAGYRLSQFGGFRSPLGRLEPLFRMQQSFRLAPGPRDGLPAVNTQRADFGLDYHFPHEVRINTSYSRQFASTGDINIWQTGIAYRFLFPTWKGKAK